MENETSISIPKFNTSPSKPSNLKTQLIVVALFLIPFAVFLLTYFQIDRQNREKNNDLTNKKIFPEMDIEAKGAYVLDVENQKVIYAKNEKAQLPLASITKVMSALVAMDEKKSFEKIKITSDSIKQEGDNGLKNEEVWTLKDLIDFSLITSSNDGMYAIASAVGSYLKEKNTLMESVDEQTIEVLNEKPNWHFIDLMNKKAKDIGLEKTLYLNETGLDFSDNESGGYGSAEDMAKLFVYVIKNNPEALEATAYREIELVSLDKIIHNAQNTNEIIEMIPNLIASKTGYTDISGGNLVVAFDPGLMKSIVISILGSTREGRFEDMKKLIETTVEYLKE